MRDEQGPDVLLEIHAVAVAVSAVSHAARPFAEKEVPLAPPLTATCSLCVTVTEKTAYKKFIFASSLMKF